MEALGLGHIARTTKGSDESSSNSKFPAVSVFQKEKLKDNVLKPIERETSSEEIKQFLSNRKKESTSSERLGLRKMENFDLEK